MFQDVAVRWRRFKDSHLLCYQLNKMRRATCTREQWRVCKKRREAYRKLAKLASEPTEQPMAVLILCLSEKTLMVVDLDLPYECEEDREDPGKTIQLLERHFIGEVNETYEFFRFFSRQQRETETVSAYIAEVRRLAGTCNFGSISDRLVRDRIVCGIRDKALQKSFLEDSKLTLKKSIDSCKAAEKAGEPSRSIEHG